MTENSKVSIITPMYNGEKYVSQTIQSVLAQTYQNWEMIIVNDGSKDNSPLIVEDYSKNDNRIILINQNNAGSAAARNNALRHATGRYICFLDSDDLWDRNMLNDQVEFISEKNAALVFASYRRIDENNNECLRPFIVPEKTDYYSYLKYCSLSCLTSMYDRDKVGVRFFKEELKSLRDDLAYWLDILRDGTVAYGNKNVLASYRVFRASTTANKRKVLKPHFNVYCNIEKLGFLRSCYYMFFWSVSGFIKYRK
jgi:teichuronic acid biosynthesis glycosyltransferase TuaG